MAVAGDITFAGGDEGGTVRWEDVLIQVKKARGVFKKLPMRHLIRSGGSSSFYV
jgi:hypothetical protein